MIIQLFFVSIVSSCYCWQYFTTFNDWRMTTSPIAEYIHSEYYFGNCFKKQGAIFYAHTHFDHLQVLGKLILRGMYYLNPMGSVRDCQPAVLKRHLAWINVPRIPTCIILRGLSGREDLLRYTSYNFQVCVPRITYCHTHTRYKYHFLEWYIPINMTGGMDWDVYFFGPQAMSW